MVNPQSVLNERAAAAARTKAALTAFRRALAYLVVFGAVMVAGSLVYLASYRTLTPIMTMAVVFGAFCLRSARRWPDGGSLL